MGLNDVISRSQGYHRSVWNPGDTLGGLLMFAVGSPNPSLIDSRFMWPGDYSQNGINERPFIRVPRDGTISRMFVRAINAGTGALGNSLYIAEVNSVDTALQVSIANAANPHVGNDTVDEINVMAGDRVAVELDWDTAVPTSQPTQIVCCILYRVT